MLKEILWLLPKLDQTAMRNLQDTLSKRFMTVAQRFGRGIINVLTGGGIVGAGFALINKLLNPLKEIQAAIDKTLSNADDIVTNAKQFESTPGKLLKLQQIGVSTGLDPQNLNQLLVKYQAALAEAKADPSKKTSVREFANDKDVVDSFFQFIQGIQKLEKPDQVRVQQEIFGEKQILKAADFLQTDFTKQVQKIAALPAGEYDASLVKLGALNDKAAENLAARNLNDFRTKAQLINDGVIKQMDQAEKMRLARENKELASYDDLKNVSIAMEEIKTKMSEMFLKLTEAVSALLQITGVLKDVSGSRFFRGAFEKLFGKPGGM